MPTIQSVNLEIVENDGAAAALVTYNIRETVPGTPELKTFIEKVELVAADESVGERGADEVIPGVGFQGALMSLGFLNLRRARLLALQAGKLDEDRRFALFDLDQDEIYARVTLSRGSTVSATGRSNIVRRGGLDISIILPPG